MSGFAVNDFSNWLFKKVPGGVKDIIVARVPFSINAFMTPNALPSPESTNHTGVL